jgi:hypothetical protein
MTETHENSDAPETGSDNDLTLDQIQEKSVGELFDRFKKMRSEERINEMTAYCLARTFSKPSDEDGIKNEDTRIEYLKEAGRNERAMLKSDGTGLDDDEDPLFAK